MTTSKQNFLAGNRATLVIDKLPSFTYAIQDYQMPDTGLPSAKMANPFVDIPFAGDKLDFGPLTISFLVEETTDNWNALHQWMLGLGFPVEHKQFKNKELSYSDATMIIYSNHQNPVATYKFFDMYPTALTGLEFSTQDPETTYRPSSATFAVTRFQRL